MQEVHRWFSAIHMIMGSVANSGAKEAKHEPLLLPIGVQAAITRCHT
jgi:hypothetical protein